MSILYDKSKMETLSRTGETILRKELKNSEYVNDANMLIILKNLIGKRLEGKAFFELANDQAQSIEYKKVGEDFVVFRSDRGTAEMVYNNETDEDSFRIDEKSISGSVHGSLNIDEDFNENFVYGGIYRDLNSKNGKKNFTLVFTEMKENDALTQETIKVSNNQPADITKEEFNQLRQKVAELRLETESEFYFPFM